MVFAPMEEALHENAGLFCTATVQPFGYEKQVLYHFMSPVKSKNGVHTVTSLPLGHWGECSLSGLFGRSLRVFQSSGSCGGKSLAQHVWNTNG